MKPKQIEETLEKKFELYFNQVENIAIAAFFETILPWLKKNGYSFNAGNGDYFIEDANGNHIYSENLPPHIQKVLDMEVPGFPANCLGSLMPDHNL